MCSAFDSCRADLVVLDARDAAQAITEQVEKLYVVKAGRVVARNARLSWMGGLEGPPKPP